MNGNGSANGMLTVGTSQEVVGVNGSPQSPHLNGGGIRPRMVGSTAHIYEYHVQAHLFIVHERFWGEQIGGRNLQMEWK